MFSYAVKHHTKKADIEACNRQNLSPLTLASKLGRFQLFNEIIQLQSYVTTLLDQDIRPNAKTVLYCTAPYCIIYRAGSWYLRALRLESDCGPLVHIFAILTLS